MEGCSQTDGSTYRVRVKLGHRERVHSLEFAYKQKHKNDPPGTDARGKCSAAGDYAMDERQN